MRQETQPKKLRLSKDTLLRLDAERAPGAVEGVMSRSCFSPEICKSFFGGGCSP